MRNETALNKDLKIHVRIIGLTGGIASGKSSVARFFQGRGVVVIDADQLAREAVKPGSSALSKIVDKFGNAVLAPDGMLNRKKLGHLVFRSASRRRELEAILHPEIARLADEHIAHAARKGACIVVYMAPLLIEAGKTDRVDEIWVVTVRPEVQVERLMLRDGIDRDAAQRIIDSQMPLSEKEKYGRIVIDNSGTPEETEMQLTTIWSRELEGRL